MLMTIMFGFFGFYRNSDNFTYNFDIKNFKKYIYTPSIRNEDITEIITNDKLINKFGINSKILIYEYNKNKFIDKYKKISDKNFLNYFQQGYRIFSFFNNIKGVLEMIKQDEFNEDDIIILCRIDVGLKIKNMDEIKNILETNDIIVTDILKMYKKIKKKKIFISDIVDDKVFIFKYKNINIFINLYEDYEKYLINYFSNNIDKPLYTHPEYIFYYHLKKNNLKIKKCDSISYVFKHVCSKYCGHNGNKTKT
jgi:hypothetical protein